MISSKTTDNKRLVAITCNCSSAVSFLKRRVPQVARLITGDKEAKVIINYEHYRLGDVLRNKRTEHIKQLAMEAGAYDFLTRPGRSSDKILVLPSKTFIDLRMPDSTLLANNKQQLKELYEITKQV